jgi:hypothetical protein
MRHGGWCYAQGCSKDRIKITLVSSVVRKVERLVGCDMHWRVQALRLVNPSREFVLEMVEVRAIHKIVGSTELG